MISSLPQTQMTVRLEPAAAAALAIMARRAGQEAADYAAGVLTRNVLDVIQETDQATATRLQAEMEIKSRAIALAQKLSPESVFDPNVTLKVFQAIRIDPQLRTTYLRAVASETGAERGNPIKSRINRALGAAIRTAVKADPEISAGNPVKVQISGELIFSYTRLKRADGSILVAQ